MRLEREPVIEIFQYKGSSECINDLTSVFGAPDELCEVEAVRHMGEKKKHTKQVLEGSKLVLGEATQTTAECEDGTKGTYGMLGAGCVCPTDFQRSA